MELPLKSKLPNKGACHHTKMAAMALKKIIKIK
jgi:hypothetical protein